MIVRWPGKTPRGITSDYSGYFADFMPTAAAIAGQESNFPTDGLSFLPSILGQKQKQKKHEYLYWEFYEGGSAQAVRMGKWKGIRFGTLEPLELYDLEADAAEQNDIGGQHPKIVAKLARIMDESRTETPFWPAYAHPLSKGKKRS